MIDYIGSGFSGWSDEFPHSLPAQAKAIAEVMDAAGTGPSIVLGHSMGGSVGIELARIRPDLVTRLIVCEGNVTPGGGVGTRRIASHDRDHYVSEVFPDDVAGWAEAALRGEDAFRSFLHGARAGVDPRALHGSSVALVNVPQDFCDMFLSLPIERHFVYGEHTFPITPDAATPDTPDPNLLRASGVGVHVIAGVGHGMMVEDVEASAQCLAPLLGADAT